MIVRELEKQERKNALDLSLIHIQMCIRDSDYYGKESFFKLHDFLEEYTPEKPTDFCAAGFILKNTLSENGGVTRGVCQVNENGYLTGIDETKNIVKVGNKAAVQKEDGQEPIDENSHVSMNMWGLTPEFVETLEKGFKEFFEKPDVDVLKGEYLLPIYIDELLQKGEVTVKVPVSYTHLDVYKRQQ